MVKDRVVGGPPLAEPSTSTAVKIAGDPHPKPKIALSLWVTARTVDTTTEVAQVQLIFYDIVAVVFCKAGGTATPTIKRNEPPEGVGTAGGSLRARGKLKPKLHPSTPPVSEASKVSA